MPLKDRLKLKQVNIANGPDLKLNNADFSKLKEQIRELLDEKIKATPIWIKYDENQQKELIKQFVEVQLANKFSNFSLVKADKEKLVKEIILESKGYGLLDELLNDAEISYILINGAKKIFVEKNGKLSKANVTFKDNNHLLCLIERMFVNAGKRLDEKNPVADVILPGGLRVNAVIPPVAIEGPSVSIKRVSEKAYTIEDLLNKGTLTKEIAETLISAVKSKKNILIIGDRCVGKTSLLNSLADLIPEEERIITIEDSAELKIDKENIVKFETDSLNNLGDNRVESKDFIAHAIKMRPDRLILDEIKGAEFVELIKAVSYEQKSFLATLYAFSVQDALGKLENIIKCASSDFSEINAKNLIVSSVNLIVQVIRLQSGEVKLSSVYENAGLEGDKISVNEIFSLSNADNLYISNGIVPLFIKNANSNEVPLEYFSKERVHTYTKALESNNNASKKQKFSAQQNPSIKNRFI